MLVIRIRGEGNGVGLILFHINNYLLYLSNTVVLNEGSFLAFLGRGPKAHLIWEFYRCLATNWENSQMKMFPIFCSGL